MQDPDAPPRRGPAVRGVLLALAAVALVGVLVRPPAGAPGPPEDPTAGPSPSSVPGDPVPTDAPPVVGATPRGGVWTTVGAAAPVDLLRPGPAVWTGAELLVGFSPRVGAFDPAAPLRGAWREVPPHPDGALEVRGVVVLPDPADARDGSTVLVHGAKTCAGCPWQPSLYALDPVAGTWTPLPDAPGPASEEDEQAAVVADQLVVTRDRGPEGLQSLAYDPATATWRDLLNPVAGPLRWQAAGSATHLLVVGVLDQPDGTQGPGALLHDLATGTWRDVGEGMPLHDPHETAIAATDDGQFLLFGGSVRGGAPRGAALDVIRGTWRPLPDLPADDVVPQLDGLGPVVGLSAAWDGERALFVGGLRDSLFLALDPDTLTWEVRLPARARAGSTASWTGRQLLLWGGVDTRGAVIDLQAWPVRPGR